jgi:pantetheine-phosphate adenylyltransferase
MRRAVFPGSFDPITLGHENIIRRALTMFDEIVVAVGVNSTKKTKFTLDQRLEMLRLVFKDVPQVRIESYKGLTVDFCAEIDAYWMLRGVRNGGDFEYERTIAQMTKRLNSSLETVILFTDPEYAPISSSVVRDILSNGGSIKEFVPRAVLEFV